jgi:hypothetical protein
MELFGDNAIATILCSKTEEEEAVLFSSPGLHSTKFASWELVSLSSIEVERMISRREVAWTIKLVVGCRSGCCCDDVDDINDDDEQTSRVPM